VSLVVEQIPSTADRGSISILKRRLSQAFGEVKMLLRPEPVPKCRPKIDCLASSRAGLKSPQCLVLRSESTESCLSLQVPGSVPEGGLGARYV